MHRGHLELFSLGATRGSCRWCPVPMASLRRGLFILASLAGPVFYARLLAQIENCIFNLVECGGLRSIRMGVELWGVLGKRSRLVFSLDCRVVSFLFLFADHVQETFNLRTSQRGIQSSAVQISCVSFRQSQALHQCAKEREEVKRTGGAARKGWELQRMLCQVSFFTCLVSGIALL